MAFLLAETKIYKIFGCPYLINYFLKNCCSCFLSFKKKREIGVFLGFFEKKFVIENTSSSL